MVSLAQFERFVEEEPQLLTKPAEEVLAQARQIAEEDEGVITSPWVTDILGEDAANVLFEKVTRDMEYVRLAFGFG